jgi:hypothetical protein
MYHYFISFIKLFYTRKYFQCFRRRKQLDAYIPRNGCLKYVLFSGRHCVQNMQRVNIFFCSAKKKNLCKENLGTKPNPTIRSIFLKNETLSEELDKWLKLFIIIFFAQCKIAKKTWEARQKVYISQNF